MFDWINKAMVLIAAVSAMALSAAALAGCGEEEAAGLPQGDETFEIDPPAFKTIIDNPYWPMKLGSIWVYRETLPDGEVRRVEVTAMRISKLIANQVEALVIREKVGRNGERVETNDYWYSQDPDGNVWWLGEDTEEYENGKVVSRAGSWQAGVNGAEPGIMMPAEPAVGMAYRQAHSRGKAEDEAEILSVDSRAEVPFGRFEDVVVTKDFTPLEPQALERRFYAPGIGLVLALDVSGRASHLELVDFTRGSG